MTNSVTFIRNNNNQYMSVINPIPDWEGFDKLIKYIQVNYDVEILKSYDGPDARRWIIRLNGEIIELIHDDGFGNYFLAPTVESEGIVKKIGEDLESRLKK